MIVAIRGDGHVVDLTLRLPSSSRDAHPLSLS